jgi:cephalosporin-C deacetylase
VTGSPQPGEPADFDIFWKQTMTETRAHPLGLRADPVDCGLSALEAYDVRFRGYGGQPVSGWMILPRERRSRLPCVVHLLWASTGRAHLVMDSRGQGTDTPDHDPAGGPVAPTGPGFVTRGVLDPRTWYYRRLFADAARAVEAARAHPAVAGDRVAVAGVSQGGGVALAAAALDGEVSAALVDVPFLCDWPTALATAELGPYGELVAMCAERPDQAGPALSTVRYGDGVAFAARVSAPALFSVALRDRICPPATVRAAYSAYAGPKQLVEYPFSGHEDASGTRVKVHAREQLAFLRRLWGGPLSSDGS